MTVKLSDIEDAQSVLKNIIIPTPILPDERLSKEIGAQAFLKAECLQRSGAFKVRGAYNKISRLSEAEKSRGVIAASAGNHAQGVALAARLHHIKATLVCPEHAPLTKVVATRAQGADVILKGKSYDEAYAYSRELQEKHGYTYVHPFDDEAVIAGQGTIGLEIARDLPDVTTVVIPIGGGGLISGMAIALKTLLPHARIVGVQAANSAALPKSLEAGEPVFVETTQTIADGIAVKRPGQTTFPIIRDYVDEVVTVTEEEIARAIFHCVQNIKLVVEGAGAAGLAALLAKKIKIAADEIVCPVLCGGNIDGNLLARIIEQVLVRQGRYIILKLLILDRPGVLATLSQHIGETGANIIEVFHRRAMWLAPLGRVGVDILLEVRDEAHGQELYQHLKNYNYHVEREGIGDWDG